VARATIQACLLWAPAALTFIASADHPEDHACAKYMEAMIRNQDPDIEDLLKPLRESERYARVMSGAWPGFPPSDLELALTPDRFEFAMPVTRREGYLQLTAAAPPGNAA
jgi:2-phosphosulfolactate phosphatase